MNWKHVAIIGGAYVLGGVGTLAYLVSQGDARLAAHKPVFTGPLPVAFFGWPFALLTSVGG